jgi:Spy/CpxP family protein refolding chaperone
MTLFALAFAAAGVLSGGPAAAQAKEPKSGMMQQMPTSSPRSVFGRERPLLSLALQNRAELALSAEQVTALQGFAERFGNDAKQRLQEIEAAERELAGLLSQDPPDLGRVEAKVRTVEKARADLRFERIRTIAEGKKVLTSEQRAKLDELAASHRGPRPGPGNRGGREMHPS